MAIPTIAAISTELLRRWGRAMARVGMDAVNATGNLDLNIPIRDGLAQAGVGMADPMIPADIDVAVLSGGTLERFRIVAEYRLCEIILNRWSEAYLSNLKDLNVTEEVRTRALDMQYKELKKRCDELMEQIRHPIKIPAAPSSGQIRAGRRGFINDLGYSDWTNGIY